MKSVPQLLYADSGGLIYDDPDLLMACFDGKRMIVPSPADLVSLPPFSRLFLLPETAAMGFDKKGRTCRISSKSETRQAVSAFLRPGYIRLYHPSFYLRKRGSYWPLWAYSAVGYHRGRYYTPAVLIDSNKRWQSESFDDREILPRIRTFKKQFRKNRIIEHLTRCAVDYHCFAAKNLFMQRWEAPLPVSRGCNARCLGCISLQEKEYFPASHERISFKPKPEEIAEIAVAHLEKAPDAIVSFGQGCEGEPLTETDLMAKSIKLIRRETARGIVHLNTNGYSAKDLKKLCDAGLDSVRISFSSAREMLYNAYYRPVNYGFQDVLESLRTCSSYPIYTTINYLVFPGITDEAEEWKALKKVLISVRPHFIHLKNLNIDPVFYMERMKRAGGGRSQLLGMKEIIKRLNKEFPEIKLGYFNRTKKEIEKHLRER